MINIQVLAAMNWCVFPQNNNMGKFFSF